MKNKKLSKIEKLIRLVNEKYKITYDEIYEICEKGNKLLH